MKNQSGMIEGPEAFQRFDSAVSHILAVSKAELEKREAEYQRKAATRPKRGPKPKTKPSASPDSAV